MAMGALSRGRKGEYFMCLFCIRTCNFSQGNIEKYRFCSFGLFLVWLTNPKCRVSPFGIYSLGMAYCCRESEGESLMSLFRLHTGNGTSRKIHFLSFWLFWVFLFDRLTNQGVQPRALGFIRREGVR